MTTSTQHPIYLPAVTYISFRIFTPLHIQLIAIPSYNYFVSKCSATDILAQIGGSS